VDHDYRKLQVMIRTGRCGSVLERWVTVGAVAPPMVWFTADREPGPRVAGLSLFREAIQVFRRDTLVRGR
jgi:hypothetical protein